MRKKFKEIHLSDIKYNSKCFICDRTYLCLEIHHLDGNSSNDNLSNALFICKKCHNSIHSVKEIDKDLPTKRRYLINTFRKYLIEKTKQKVIQNENI